MSRTTTHGRNRSVAWLLLLASSLGCVGPDMAAIRRGSRLASEPSATVVAGTNCEVGVRGAYTGTVHNDWMGWPSEPMRDGVLLTLTNVGSRELELYGRAPGHPEICYQQRRGGEWESWGIGVCGNSLTALRPLRFHAEASCGVQVPVPTVLREFRVGFMVRESCGDVWTMVWSPAIQGGEAGSIASPRELGNLQPR